MWPYLPENPCGCTPCESSNESTTNVGSDNVKYVGPPLTCTGIEPCDSLTTVLQKIDAKICALVAQFEICCTTTTTTTTIYCESYMVQGTGSFGTWSGVACDGSPLGGFVGSGETVLTGCMRPESLDLFEAVIKQNLGSC